MTTKTWDTLLEWDANLIVKALEASIAHWDDNAKATTPDDASVDGDDCALCGLFFEIGCAGCPVRWATAKRLCKGSPYRDACAALREWAMHSDDPGYAAHFRNAAEAERDFLLSLRAKL